MPRLNSGQELYKYLNTVTKYVIQSGTIGDQTVAGAIAALASTVTLPASTNFTAADPVFIIGDGGVELQTIGTPSTTMPVTRPIAIAQSAGARFVEAVAIPLGHVAEAGAKFGGTYTLTPIKAATSRVAIAYFPSPAELTFEIPLLGHNNLNMQAAFGATEGETGAGTSSDPYTAVIKQNTVGTQSTQCLRLAGVEVNAKNVEIDLLDCTIEVNVSKTVGAASPEGFTLTGKCTAIVQRIW